MTAPPTAIVIGAGIVGVASALSLLREGLAVTLVDRLEPGMATSFGNAGSISPSAVMPVSMPGMARKVPGWLLDPLGPLTVRWRHLPRVAPWLRRFLRHGTWPEVERVAKAMGTLMQPVFEDYARLLPGSAFESMIRRDGCLYVYETEAEFAGAARGLDLRRGLGHRMEPVGPDEMQQLEPALARRFAHGIFAPDNGRTVDPSALVKAIADRFRAEGGIWQRADVRGLEMSRGAATGIRTGEGVLFADRIVIAAGAWSTKLTVQLGLRIPLESQRGYHVTFPHPGIGVNRTVMWNRRSVFVNPMALGLRIAGTVELAGLTAEPNMGRADALARIASEMFPDLDPGDRTRWMGHRPCLPDSLPVIDFAPDHDNVILAFGHQHVGMCSGASTGRLVADLAVGRTPGIDLAPFSATRFKRARVA